MTDMRAPRQASCYTCEHYGKPWGRSYVLCERDPVRPHVQARPETGCVFWLRAPGADDVTPDAQNPDERRCTA